MKYILPKGFKAGGMHSGVKRFRKDLALLCSESPCKAVGLFTKNKVKAAPVVVTKDILKKTDGIRAVIVNSGNANCCTGKYGVRDAKRMIASVCDSMDLDFNEVCVSSTGIIGKRLPTAPSRKPNPRVNKLTSAHISWKLSISIKAIVALKYSTA